jgi:hypothetical protein
MRSNPSPTKKEKKKKIQKVGLNTAEENNLLKYKNYAK